jgi:hypothetical protein
MPVMARDRLGPVACTFPHRPAGRLPDRNIAEAQVHATLALAAATAVAALAPDSRAWADVAGTKFASG